MSRFFVLTISMILSLSAFAMSGHYLDKYKQRHTPSSFNVIPLNSPVKGNVAKFLIKAPSNLKISETQYKILRTPDFSKKMSNYSITDLVNGPQGKEIHIQVNSLKDGFYRLFVKVKAMDSKSKDKHKLFIFDFKNAYHDFVKFVVKKDKEVSMPDPIQNKATLLGIDSDQDGIRDDIQIWINQKYTDENLKLALRQFAKALATRFANKDNKELSIAASFESIRSSECLTSTLLAKGTLPKNIMQTQNELNAFYLDTKERIFANDQVKGNFHGQLIEMIPSEISCDF